jgi:hypothetical protein
MRRRWLVGLGALALLLAGCDAGSSSQDTGGSGSGSGPDAPTGIDNAPYVCPDRTHQVQPTGADVLPTGATAARLCGVFGTSPAWRAPAGDLRTGLDHLVRLVNSRRILGAQPGTGCAQQGGRSWALVLRYPSGTRTITGDNAGCWDLRVGITERWGAQRVYDAYLAALLRQRRQDGSPGVLHPGPRCPRHAVSVSEQLQDPAADPTALGAASVLCVLTARDARTVELPRSAVTALHRDLATAAGRPADVRWRSHCRSLAPGAQVLLRGSDAWGGRFSVLFRCDVYRLLPAATYRYRFVRLLPATEQALRQVLRG